ncbi:GAF domain-containing protein [Streptomyces sp. CRN 30]|uniref:GAF domain-containing protein n=1 Tax=Streptomyces sp. CRN 30 TaxID=3075613 RepID=UPI002A7F8093|nr:GAF domain-containing protein [Streptomyces sp. CRN 30]
MTYDPPRPPGRLLLTPEDKDAPARVRRLRLLGLGERPEPALDALAHRLAQHAQASYAMITFVDEHRQFFAGLCAPEGAVRGPDGVERTLGRHLDRSYGFCPHVVVRRKALVLEDVHDYPRFAGNPVVDEIGIRSYLGAPLVDSTGIALGTVCVADTAPRPWGRAGLESIKATAADLTARLEQRETLP